MGTRIFAGRGVALGLPGSLTSFVGRRPELVQLRRLLAEHRLISIVGRAGIGKTRLALELARAGSRAGFVPLESISDPLLLPDMIAAASGVAGSGQVAGLEALAAALGDQSRLLVMDGCEGLLDACAELIETLLHSCPSLVVLTTSREPLAIPGEVTWGLQRLPAAAAEELFVERCRLSRPDLEWESDDLQRVARIAERLDGVPLALELAALRLRTLSLADLEERMEDWIQLTTGGVRTKSPERQTMRSAVEQSHHLLDEQEQALFARLSVFRGRFSLASAEAVCGLPPAPAGSVLGVLASLVEKSLVNLEPEGYRLPDSLRGYAWETLVHSGSAEDIRRRHAESYLERLERGWQRPLAFERDNLRAALEWAHAADHQTYVRLCSGLGPEWLAHGDLIEGGDRVGSALELGIGSTETVAKLRTAAAALALARGETESARLHAAAAGADGSAVRALSGATSPEEALPLLEAVLPSWRSAALGAIALRAADGRLAEEHFRACLEAGGLATLAGLAGLAELAALRHDHERALRLEGGLSAARRVSGAARPGWWPDPDPSPLRASAHALGAGAARAARQRGEKMPAADLLLYAAGDARPGDPSQRELEIARLIAEGLTNRQIAGRLHLSVRTIEGHVERLRGKLGFATRSRIASWLAESQVAIE